MSNSVEDGLERRAVVYGLPEAADRIADVGCRRVLLVEREVVDAPALPGGADGPPAEAAEHRVVRNIDRRWRRRRSLSLLGRECDHERQYSQDGNGNETCGGRRMAHSERPRGKANVARYYMTQTTGLIRGEVATNDTHHTVF